MAWLYETQYLLYFEVLGQCTNFINLHGIQFCHGFLKHTMFVT